MFEGERVALWRKKKKLTQEELAVKVNVTKAAISNYENGHSTPSNETLVALADALNIDTDYLLGRTDKPNVYELNSIHLEDEIHEKAERYEESGTINIDEDTRRKIDFFRKLESDLGLDLSDPDIQKKLKRAAKIIFSNED